LIYPIVFINDRITSNNYYNRVIQLLFYRKKYEIKIIFHARTNARYSIKYCVKSLQNNNYYHYAPIDVIKV